MGRNSDINNIYAELTRIRCEMHDLKKIVEKWDYVEIEIKKHNILELPKHLQQTVLTVKKLGKATAYQVTLMTHKARAVESAYCNQLTFMGWLRKEREGRKCFFALKKERVKVV